MRHTCLLRAALVAAALALAGTPALAQLISTYAGTGVTGFSGDGGAATSATIKRPNSVAIDAAGNLYIADSTDARIRKVTPAGIISTIAGSGVPGFSGDGGSAIPAQFNSPNGLAFDAAGNLYVADTGNGRVRRITPAGVIATVAGTGTCNTTAVGDGGAATAAPLCAPIGIAIDASGNVYVSDITANRVRRFTVGGFISTFAGNGFQGGGGDNGVPTLATLNGPQGLAIDTGGTLYIADTNNNRVRTVSGGIIRNFAGTGTFGFAGDGNLATSAQLSSPTAVLLLPSGVLISDGGNARIRRVAGGVITTLAGNGTSSPPGDGGYANTAGINGPRGLAVDAQGAVYLAEQFGSRIRKLVFVPDRPVVTNVVPGLGTLQVFFTPPNVGGAQSITQFTVACGASSQVAANSPVTIFGLSAGTSYTCTVVARNAAGDSLPGSAATPTSPITTTTTSLASPGVSLVGQPVTLTATVTGANATGPIQFRDNGPLIAGCESVALQVISPTQSRATCTSSAFAAGSHSLQATYGGNASNLSSNGFAGLTVLLNSQAISFGPLPGLATDAAPFVVSATGGASGNPVVFDSQSFNTCVTTGTNGSTVKLTGRTGQCTIRATQAGNAGYNAAPFVFQSFGVSASVNGVPLVSAVAGTGQQGFDADLGAGAATRMVYAGPLAVDLGGTVYYADVANRRIRKVNAGGLVTNVAGNGTDGFSGDGGPATAAAIGFVTGIAVDVAGNVFFVDSSHHRVRKVNTGGTISTVAGNGTPAFSGDGGPATAASFSTPWGVALDAAGNLYITDQGNSRVRKVAPGGTITTLAGTGQGGTEGDGGPAISATVGAPSGIAVDPSGNLYVSQTAGPYVRKIDTGGIITTIAGTGTNGSAGDGGAALSAQLDFPQGLVADAGGNVYVADSHSHRIRKISVLGLITTVAGTGTAGQGADGIPAVASAIDSPLGVALDASGQLYVADSLNSRVRKVTFPPADVPMAPAITQVTPGNGQATVAFAARYDGNAPILDFTVQCGGASLVVSLPPAVVTGLANDVPVTCTVTARNAIGTSSASAPSASVTPFAPLPPQFTSATPPGGTINAPYAHTVTVTGGPVPTLSLATGALPTGLAFDAASGAISGTPTVAGLFTGSFKATNGLNPDAMQAFSIAIAKLAQSIAFGAAPALVAGNAALVSATGGASGNPVVFASATPSVCATGGTNGATVTGLAAGTCTIAANQAGDATYADAPTVSLGFPVGAAVDPAASANITVAQSVAPASPSKDKDVVYTINVSNAGPVAATNVVLTDLLPAGVTFIWAHPGCTHDAGTVTCPIGSLAAGASAQRKIVVRPTLAGAITNTATAAAAQPDIDLANNANNATIAVSVPPAGVAVQRYRLFSPVTLEHLYTTDLNEYNVLGSFVGTWVQEGTIGKVFDNPGSFAGVAATPYYRLYNTSNAQHHWTTDPNEYYTLVLFPQYSGEGVDGYLFPTQAAGTVPLYRLLYPFTVPVAGLHHWTIDAAEYNALITTFGWIGEGGSGFVIP